MRSHQYSFSFCLLKNILLHCHLYQNGNIFRASRSSGNRKIRQTAACFLANLMALSAGSPCFEDTDNQASQAGRTKVCRSVRAAMNPVRGGIEATTARFHAHLLQTAKWKITGKGRVAVFSWSGTHQLNNRIHYNRLFILKIQTISALQTNIDATQIKPVFHIGSAPTAL
ncbi:MAG: hypothetical protein Q4G28_11040 [Neisseria sp.]|nr:hypothetical protein [Neisseria sp.]